MKFVEFQQIDGDPVTVNPDEVSFIEPRGQNGVRIWMKNGRSTIVQGDVQTVTAKLEE